MNLAAALAWGIDLLAQSHIEDARMEAEILLGHALNLPRSALISKGQNPLGEKEQKEYENFLQRRANHEPTAYIVGYQPFMGLDFMVDDNVLIPRPETELLVETVIKIFRTQKAESRTPNTGITIIDIGTGSGCIAIALAKKLPEARIIGIDSSKAAINLALNNARKNGVEKNCCFLLGDLFSPIKDRVDLIVSNPPYIPSAEIGTLQPEVKDWEPKAALDGGKDGLDLIKKLLTEAPRHLKPEGRLIMEFGFGQGDEIKRFASKYFSKLEIIRDYAGIPRILVALEMFYGQSIWGSSVAERRKGLGCGQS